MLTPHEIERIYQLAANHLSQREISRQTGHSRRQIAAILNGRRFIKRTQSPKIQLRRSRLRIPDTRHLPYTRCKDCGRLVQHPCVACKIERLTVIVRYLKAA